MISFLAILGIMAIAPLAYSGHVYLRSVARRDTIRSLMGPRYRHPSPATQNIEVFQDSSEELESIALAREMAPRKTKSNKLAFEERIFQAGLFSEEQHRDFRRLQIVLPTALAMVGGGLGSTTSDPFNILILAVAGICIGMWLPLNRLGKWTKQRNDDIMFYLPLVIEQISIGVSSSLDIGPCLAKVVQMADERDAHNPVTELLRFAQGYIKSGVNLQDALNEVGRRSGNSDVLHAFKALAQVARYGGEISKQLQDLSEAVASSRESKIEEKIKKLELSATGPVAMVFAGFLLILLIGFGMVLLQGLESS